MPVHSRLRLDPRQDALLAAVTGHVYLAQHVQTDCRGQPDTGSVRAGLSDTMSGPWWGKHGACLFYLPLFSRNPFIL